MSQNRANHTMWKTYMTWKTVPKNSVKSVYKQFLFAVIPMGKMKSAKIFSFIYGLNLLLVQLFQKGDWVKHSLHFKKSNKTFCISGDYKRYIKASSYTVSGWGKTKDGGKNSNLLQGLNVPPVRDDVCAKQYPDKITSHMICAGFPEGGKLFSNF